MGNLGMELKEKEEEEILSKKFDGIYIHSFINKQASIIDLVFCSIDVANEQIKPIVEGKFKLRTKLPGDLKKCMSQLFLCINDGVFCSETILEVIEKIKAICELFEKSNKHDS